MILLAHFFASLGHYVDIYYKSASACLGLVVSALPAEQASMIELMQKGKCDFGSRLLIVGCSELTCWLFESSVRIALHSCRASFVA